MAGNSSSNTNHNYYLVSAMIDGNGEIIEKSALPVRDTFIAIDDVDVLGANLEADEHGVISGAQPNDESLQVYLTNQDGVISNFNTGKQTNVQAASLKPFETGSEIKTISQKAKLYFPPTRLLTYTIATKGYDGWLDDLRESLKTIIDAGDPIAAHFPLGNQILDEADKEPQTFSVERIFDEPLKEGGNPTEQAYRRWYEENKGRSIKAIILPRVRAISIVFSSEHYLGATVSIYNANGEQVFYDRPVHNGEEESAAEVKEIFDGNRNPIGYGAVLYDAASEYDHGAEVKDQIYRIEVIVNEDKADALGLNSNVYSIAERLRFNIQNLAGEFELINGDAISLEEALIKQFPVVYRHVIEQAHMDSNPVANISSFPKSGDGLLSYVHGLKTTLDVTKNVSDVLGAETGQEASIKLGKQIFDNLSSVNGIQFGGATFSDVVNIAFNVHDTSEKIVKIIKSQVENGSEFFQEVQNTLEGSQGFTQSNIEALKKTGAYNKLEQYAAITGEAVEDLLVRIDQTGIANKFQAGLKRIELPAEFTKKLTSAKQSLRKVNKFVRDNKVVGRLGVVSDAASLFISSYKYAQARGDNANARSNLTTFSKDYAHKVHMVDSDQTHAADVTDKAIEAINSIKSEYGEDVQVLHRGDRYYVNVSFGFDESAFSADDSLQSFADVVSQIPADINLTLIGHTCDIGSIQYNQYLSERRADSVRSKLLELGINNGKATVNLKSEGRGKSEQRYKQREKNRRVEAVLELIRLRRYYPSREGMDVLERYRSISTFTLGETQDKLVATFVSAMDAAMAIPPVHPGIAATQLIWVVGKTLIDIGQFTEKLIFGEDFLALLEQKDKRGVESINNQILLMDGQEDDGTVDGSDLLEYQLRLRAEALTGLLRLLMRCSIEDGGWLENLKSDDNLINSSKERSDFSYAENIKHYEVEKYIETFILNDGWSLPINPIFPVCLDDYWIHLVENKKLDTILTAPDSTIDERLKAMIHKETGMDLDLDRWILQGPAYMAYDLSAELVDLIKKSVVSRPFQGFDYVMASTDDQFNAYRHEALTADFQESFPIHHMASKSLDVFADQFNVDFTGLTKQAYLHTSIHARSMGHHSSSSAGWVPLDNWLNRSEGLSPLHQIRICILLDSTIDEVKKVLEGDSPKMIPVQVNPVRLDGINMSGPTTTGFISKLKAGDLLESEKEVLIERGILDEACYDPNLELNVYGVILNPFFMYGVNKVYGTKPMAGAFSSWLNLNEDDKEISGLWNWRGRWEMEYSYEVTLAYKASTRQSIEYKSGKDTFEISLDTDRIHKMKNAHGVTIEEKEDYLLDSHFLSSEGQNEPYPDLLKDTKTFSFLKYGNKSQYVHPNKIWREHVYPKSDYEKQRSILELNDFSWRNRVQMLVLVVCDEIEKDRIESRGLKWHVLSAQAHLGLDNAGPSKNGPTYDFTLNHLGSIEHDRYDLRFRWDKKEEERDERFKDLAEPFENEKVLEMLSGLDAADNLGEDLWDQLIDEMFGSDKKKSVYAGYIDLDYQCPTGRMLKGLKPFHAKTTPFSYNFEQGYSLAVYISTQGNSGLKNERALGAYRLPYPTGFERENAHWYITPDKEELERAEEIIKRNEIIKSNNADNRAFDPTIPISPWIAWNRLSGEGEPFWNEKRKAFVDKWLVDQAERRFLPSGDLRAFTTKEEVD